MNAQNDSTAWRETNPRQLDPQAAAAMGVADQQDTAAARPVRVVAAPGAAEAAERTTIMPTYNFKAIQEFLWFVFLEFAAVVTLAFYNSETVTDWRTWVGITVLNGLRAAAGYIISWINARRAPVPQ